MDSLDYLAIIFSIIIILSIIMLIVTEVTT